MTITDRTYQPRPLRSQETTLGHPRPWSGNPNTRSLESHGAFVLPWLQRGQRVLDYGCGPGTITLGLAQQVFPGQVTGLDENAGNIGQAERLAFGLEQVNASFRTGGPDKLPFEDHSFDLIFAQDLESPEERFAELRRVLRPDGILALCTSDWAQLKTTGGSPLLDQALQAYRENRAANPLPDLLEQAGFHLLARETHWEQHENTLRLAEDLARDLEEQGEISHARTLREWARQPEARFHQAWTSVVGI